MGGCRRHTSRTRAGARRCDRPGARLRDRLSRARGTLPADLDADVVVARGDSIEEAVQSLSWEPGELAIVGSSRLAQPRRLFLGSTAAKMLHELPVPMVVVPRTRVHESMNGERR